MKDELIEKLAELEHLQWESWAKKLIETENISKKTMDRWQPYFVPYDELDEEIKERDRKWARQVLEVLKLYKLKTCGNCHYDLNRNLICAVCFDSSNWKRKR